MQLLAVAPGYDPYYAYLSGTFRLQQEQTILHLPSNNREQQSLPIE